ncbi:MAG: class II fructose-bisphosphate aldolase, partial [Lachnospiraceae bacterium]|nr:class II fructose-bisphosphate aldolase [Lachnospiraceae bacterium]
MLVSATEMLKKAKAGHYVVGQFNINNLEWTKAILATAQECKSPVILGVSEGAGKYMGGYHVVVNMVNGLLKDMDISVPVALHLDHGSFEGCYKCIEAGFSSIMFDGSHYAIDENVAKTTELVAVAHGKGLSIEAEVGSIGGEEDGVVGAGECADPDECKMIADLGVAKINVNTECQLAFADATRKYIEAGKDLEGKGFDPRK